MTFYKDLNDVKLDLSEFEEHPLSKHEQRRISKQARKKITPKHSSTKWIAMSAAAIAVCALSLFTIIGKETIANVPFIGETIEKYINQNEDLNYSSYKTAIGETAENEFGQLTLNEVMLDHDHLFLSATFEPAENVDFNYQTQITPQIKINGEDYTVQTGAQSIEINNSMFTIYNEIKLRQAVHMEDISIKIDYDTIFKEPKNIAIEQPWTFAVNISRRKH